MPPGETVVARVQEAPRGSAYVPLGAHLVGSVPLANAEEVFRLLGGDLGDRLRRIPDGETGPRADWIVWQYPVLSSRSQFEVAPPTPRSYRALPRLRLRGGEDDAELAFEQLGYAEAALSSFRAFSLLKRDGDIPRGCRFQVSLPTPLAPISAFVALEDQAVAERAYEAAMVVELEQILMEIPQDQLALQWDTNFEFGMLEGDVPVWFPDVKGGILERLIRISRLVPPDVELGFHFCFGHDETTPRHVPADMSRMVEIANALAASLDRPLNWVHMPVSQEADAASLAPLRDLRLQAPTELYLGLVHPGEPEPVAQRRIADAHAAVGDFGIATPCGWGRMPPRQVPALVATHTALSRPIADPLAQPDYVFTWPEGFPRIPGDDWIDQPVDAFGLHYDTVENHGWYDNLDLTVEQLAEGLDEGEILIDYSGGTGILLDRLQLRVFDRQVGMVIVDSSPKFLRVALERFHSDERVAFRRLRFLKEQKRLEYVDEVLGDGFPGADVLVSTNAIHLYDDLENTLRAWARVLRPGGRVHINSGNLRNPRAAENEWIIDETVYVVHEVATGLVRTDPRWAEYRAVLDDSERMRAYLDWRDRVFLAPRPLDHYLEALSSAGFAIEDVTERTIEARVDEWYEFLAAYADAVLGWVGGSAKVDGEPATEEAAAARLELLRDSLNTIFGGRPTFRCCWTYVSATRN
jgi:ubiquinone/menaquinone biosynthesis C-methylase UbiE